MTLVPSRSHALQPTFLSETSPSLFFKKTRKLQCQELLNKRNKYEITIVQVKVTLVTLDKYMFIKSQIVRYGSEN